MKERFHNAAAVKVPLHTLTGVELGNAFCAAVRDELYRRQYVEEREHPEWVDHGGEA